MSNLFAVIDSELMVPAMNRCGAAGGVRTRVGAQCPQTGVVESGGAALSAIASEVFLRSSVRGILPLQSWGKWNDAGGVVAGQLQQHERNRGWMMEQGG